MAAADAQRKAADAAAYARLDAACSTRAPAEFNDVQTLMMTGRVLQLRRVEGDDGPGDQIVRYVLADPRDNGVTCWDVYMVRRASKVSYRCRKFAPESWPIDLTEDWATAFAAAR